MINCFVKTTKSEGVGATYVFLLLPTFLWKNSSSAVHVFYHSCQKAVLCYLWLLTFKTCPEKSVPGVKTVFLLFSLRSQGLGTSSPRTLSETVSFSLWRESQRMHLGHWPPTSFSRHHDCSWETSYSLPFVLTWSRLLPVPQGNAVGQWHHSFFFFFFFYPLQAICTSLFEPHILAMLVASFSQQFKCNYTRSKIYLFHFFFQVLLSFTFLVFSFSSGDSTRACSHRWWALQSWMLSRLVSSTIWCVSVATRM